MTLMKFPQCVFILSVFLFLLSRVREDDITPNIASGVDLHCDIFPHIQPGREDITNSQPGKGTYYPQYHRGVHPLVILFLISWDAEDNASGNIAGVLHTHCALVPNNMIWLPVSRGGTSSCDIISYIQGERIFLPISQGLYTPPVILFVTSRRGEHNITLNISAGVHLVCNIFHNIQDRRGW